jgi:hypothetical protein
VTPATGAQVIVPEEMLRWPDTMWPAFPSAEDLAKSVVRAVGVTIDVVRQAGLT